MWEIKDSPIEDKLDIFLKQVLQRLEVNMPEVCPICSANDVHMYLNRNKVSKLGGVWVWCSNCRHYSHGSIVLPEWWENCNDVPQNDLTSAPDVLEDMKFQIDKHVNELLKKNNI